MKRYTEKAIDIYVEPDNFPYFCEYELHVFAENQDYSSLKSMLEEFPEYVNCVNSVGYTPLAVVTKTIWELNTDTEKRIMELLFSYGADPMMPHFDEKPIASHAFRNGDAEVLMIFARNLVDIDTYLEGYTPLHYAVSQCEYDLAKYCLDRNADVHQLYPNDMTLVHVALVTHNYYMIPLLLDYGCDVNAKISDGSTGLHLAVVYNNGQNAVRDLIKYKADLNAQNSQGDTPLNLVAQQHYFNYESFEHLVNNGCDIDIPDFYGFTPLHKISYSFRFGRYDKKFRTSCRSFVRTLLKKGANAFALTHFGDTVLDTALRNNRMELAEILIKYITPKLFGRYQRSDPMIYSFERHPKFRSLARKCVAEYSKLDRFIAGTRFTYRDLANDYRKIVKYATDEDVARDIKHMMQQRHRLYKDELTEECTKVLHMAKMLTLLTEIFQYVLPLPCIEKILEYVTPEDCAETYKPRLKEYQKRAQVRRQRNH